MRARATSEKSAMECACAIGQPLSVYQQLELHPGDLTLNEVAALCRLFGSAGAHIAEAALIDLCR